MPVMRTSMSAIKPVKTERTHEENQERAYIAASRRSDRSLEARVESARRASEIHKRRTGRSLRVTEEDVVNEEMYEEEDDDLPTQYRRLTAHLTGQNANFTRRMQDYVHGQMAVRAAFGSAMVDGWNNNNNSFQPNGQFMNPNMMQMQYPTMGNEMLPPQMFNRQASYRQTPYPLPQNGTQQQGMRPTYHSRSASIASPHDMSMYHQQPQFSAVEHDRHRRMSGNQMSPQTPSSQHGQSPPALSRVGSSSNMQGQQVFYKTMQSPQQMPTPPTPQQAQSQQSSPTHTNFKQQIDNGPLTMTLPMESQQLLAANPNFDYNDPVLSGMMSSPTHVMPGQQPFYSYNPNGNKVKSASKDGSQTSFTGLHQTLTPSHIDTSVGSAHNMFTNHSPPSAGSDHLTTPASFNLSFDPLSMNQMKGSATASNASGQITPQNVSNDFDSFFNYELNDDLLFGTSFGGFAEAEA